MFILLTAASDPQKDPRARALAEALKKRGRAFLVSVHPRCADFPEDAESLVLLLRRLIDKHPPKLVFALDATSAAFILKHRFLKSLAWVLCLGRDGLAGELAEQAFHAREIWISGDKKDLPRGLRPRAAAFPQNGGLEPRLRRLLDEPRLEKPRYPLTSLIIPVYNARDLLRRCLESLKRHTRLPHEIILINNASDAATTRYLKGLHGVRLISNAKNLGFARAINQGMRAARGQYLGWINSDTVYTPQWLERMIDCLQFDAAFAAAGPMTNRTAGAQLVRFGADKDISPKNLDRFATAWSLRHSGLYQEAHRLTGFCLLLKRRAMEAVGLLDERFGKGTYEDYDYCLRLRQAGFKLALAKDVFVFHAEHASFGSQENFDAHCDGNKEIFVQKWTARSLEFLDQLDCELASGLHGA